MLGAVNCTNVFSNLDMKSGVNQKKAFLRVIEEAKRLRCRESVLAEKA
jgi:hypothetical protein